MTYPGYQTYPRKKSKAPLIIGLIVAGVLALCGIGACVAVTMAASTPTPVDSFAPTLPASPTTPAGKSGQVNVQDGTWTVGVDIPPGTYKVAQPIGDGLAYWSITTTGSNGQDIVANGAPEGGRPQVTLKKGQDFETRGCGTWVKIK